MADNSNKRIAINMMAQTVSFIVNVLINFFLTPYVTAKVGKSVYGFVNLAFQMTGYVTIFTTAINAMVGRYITINISRKDYKNANTYFSSVVVANAVMALVMLVPSVYLILFLEKIFDIPQGYVLDVKLLWAFIFANFLITLVTQFYGVATYATNRLDLSSKRSMETNVIKALILGGCFFFFVPKLWYVGLANFICGFYVVVTNIYYAKKLTPELKFDKLLVKLSAVKELISVGIWNSIQLLSETLINGCDMIIANKCIDAASMTLMSYAKTIPNYIVNFITMIASSFVPQMTILYGKGEMDSFIKQTKSACKVCGFLCSVPVIGFLAFGTDFFSLWLYALDDGEVNTVQLLSVMILMQTVLDVYIRPLTAINGITCKLKVPVLISIGIGVLNVILSVVFCVYTPLGIYAIQIVSTVLLTLKAFFFSPVYAAHILNLKWYTFYPPLLRGIFASFVTLVIFGGYRYFVSINSWLMLVVSAAVCGVAGYAVNYIIVLNKNERDMVKNLVNKKLKKA